MPGAGRALLLHRGTEAVAPVPLPDDGGLFRVGREEPADLPLRDAAVSREHAQFESHGDDWILTDLDSANGTFVNGRRIRRRTLKPGDTVRFGTSVEFRYCRDAPRAPFVEFLLTLFRHALVARDVEAKPRRIPVGPAARLVGRSAKAEVRLSFPEISDVHARLENRAGRPWVVDQKSRNGTFVAGVRVRDATLPPGTVVEVGRTRTASALTSITASRSSRPRCHPSASAPRT